MPNDASTPDPTDAPGSTPDKIDPARLKDAHGRTGRMLKQAGLPFESDEFDGDGDDEDSSSSSSSSSPKK